MYREQVVQVEQAVQAAVAAMELAAAQVVPHQRQEPQVELPM
jgi:hypothetical protein